MIGYITIGSLDFHASAQFYDAVLATLGYTRLFDYSETGWIAYGEEKRKDQLDAPTLWLCKTPFNGKPAVAANGSMFGLSAPSRTAVDLFYKTALANGGTSEGEPGLREAYGPHWYLAYLRDPMGNKFSIIYRGA
jgi:catechol 2,3-dioxygenase-like lactoylglutathione lyase family enzyme